MKFSFGNVVTLLSNKLGEIENDVPLWQIKGCEKLIKAITKIKNCMMELSNLASKHEIEASLFHHINTVKNFRIIGRKRQNDVMIKLIESMIKLIESYYCEKEKWYKIIKYLKKELRIKEQIILFENSNPKKMENLKTQNEKEKIQVHSADHSRSKKCFICEKLTMYQQ